MSVDPEFNQRIFKKLSTKITFPPVGVEPTTLTITGLEGRCFSTCKLGRHLTEVLFHALFHILDSDHLLSQ